MRELRLVPLAATVWLTTVLVLHGHPWAAGAAVLLLAGGAVVWRAAGHAVLLFAGGVLSWAAVVWRQRWMRGHVPGGRVRGVIDASPVSLEGGRYLVRLNLPGYPAQLPVVVEADGPGELLRGATLSAEISARASDRAGLGGVMAAARRWEVLPPDGIRALSAQVRECFNDALLAHVGPASRGLASGMVLGDTSAQAPWEKEVYVVTGLSHLSAVSGANVTLVTAAAALAIRAVGLGPRYQVGAALLCVAGFVILVGTEPSVVRAAVMGVVGLVGMVASSRVEPFHALCLAVIGLLVWWPDMAVSWGFALSVVATAGIVAGFPAVYRALVRLPVPDVVVRALAVAVVADVVTMPLVAVMAGRVSLVSVPANLLAAPVVAPVTVLGLVAVLLSLLPGPCVAVPLWGVEPCTWWIHHVALVAQALPWATTTASMGWLVVCYGWIGWFILVGKARWVAAVAVGILTISLLQLPWSQRCTAPYRVDSEDQIPELLPAGVCAVEVVGDGGAAPDRPSATPTGIPVLYGQRHNALSRWAP